MFTRGAALIFMALGSLILLGLSSWLIYAGAWVGWVFFAIGLLGWLMFMGAVATDVRNARGGTT